MSVADPEFSSLSDNLKGGGIKPITLHFYHEKCAKNVQNCEEIGPRQRRVPLFLRSTSKCEQDALINRKPLK